MLMLLTAFTLSLISICLLVKLPKLHIALDTPNMRSLHQKVTPRTGGLGLMIGVTVSWILLPVDFRLIGLCIFLCGLSLVDDINGLPIHVRFASHFVAAIIFAILVLKLHDIFYVSLLTIGIVWMTNLYNFMDGSDGLAGGMALFGFSACAVAAYLAHDHELTYLSASIASSSLAFLIFNFNPAKIFMGDVGSITLGFLVAVVGLLGIERHLWAWWFPLLVFSPFIIDATITILKRLLNGEKIWQAHKSHYYQRLIQMGWTHRKTAIFEYFFMCLVGFSAVFLIDCSRLIQLLVICCWCLVYLIIMVLIDKKWHNFQKHKTM